MNKLVLLSLMSWSTQTTIKRNLKCGKKQVNKNRNGALPFQLSSLSLHFQTGQAQLVLKDHLRQALSYLAAFQTSYHTLKSLKYPDLTRTNPHQHNRANVLEHHHLKLSTCTTTISSAARNQIQTKFSSHSINITLLRPFSSLLTKYSYKLETRCRREASLPIRPSGRLQLKRECRKPPRLRYSTQPQHNLQATELSTDKYIRVTCWSALEA